MPLLEELKLLDGEWIGYYPDYGWITGVEFGFMVFILFVMGYMLFKNSLKTLLYTLYSQFTPIVSIQDLQGQNGVVEITGHAQSMTGQTLVSPLSGVECLYYYYKVEEQITDQYRSEWVVVDMQTEMVPIHICDGTGTARLDWEWVDMQLDPHIQTSTCNPETASLPAGVVRYLRKQTDPRGLANRKIRIMEVAIRPQEPLRILGTVLPGESDIQSQAPVRIGQGGWLTPFYASNRTEKQLYRYWGKDLLIRFALGCGLFFLLGYVIHNFADLNRLLSQSEPEAGHQAGEQV